MRVPNFTPTGVLAPLRAWMDAVRGILANGWTIQDNALGEVKVVRWDKATNGTLTVSTTRKRRPTAVICLGAETFPTSTNDGVVYGNLSVAWRWMGDESASIQVSAISLIDTGAWDATLWIVGG